MLYGSFRADNWPLAVVMPATFGFLGGAIAARLAAWPRKIKHLRGTTLRPFTGARGGRLWARLTGGVTTAGVPLTRQDAPMPVPPLRSSRPGQTTALRSHMVHASTGGERQGSAPPGEPA